MPGWPPRAARARAAARSRPRPPGRPPGDRHGHELRETLLDAATELAVERGFESVGLREIADRAGASAGMIAYYFRDREGLYEALFERAFDRVWRQVEGLLEAEGASDADLEELTRIHVAALAADPWIPQLIAREVLARDTGMRALFAERVVEGPLRATVQWLEKQVAAGRLRADLDLQLTAMSIAALAVFPYLFGAIVGPRAGIRLDDAFRERLIAHNQRFVSLAVRARPEPSS